MKKSNTLSFNAIFKLLALLSANGAIIIALMHLVFHFIDSVNFSVAFLDSEVTNVLMITLSVLSAFTAIYVMYTMFNTNSKSYFFKKVAFITFWICVINILIQKNVILPGTVKDNYGEMIWFFISIFTFFNSIYCNGILCMEKNK